MRLGRWSALICGDAALEECVALTRKCVLTAASNELMRGLLLLLSKQ